MHGCIYEVAGPWQPSRVSAGRAPRDERCSGGRLLALSLSLSLFLSAELLPVVFPRDEFITSPRFGKFQENERKDTVATHRVHTDSPLGFFDAGYVPFVQLARIGYSPTTTHFSKSHEILTELLVDAAFQQTMVVEETITLCAPRDVVAKSGFIFLFPFVTRGPNNRVSATGKTIAGTWLKFLLRNRTILFLYTVPPMSLAFHQRDSDKGDGDNLSNCPGSSRSSVVLGNRSFRGRSAQALEILLRSSRDEDIEFP